MRLLASILFGLLSGGVVLAYAYTRTLLATTRIARDAWRQQCDVERRAAAQMEQRLGEHRSNAIEWRAQAIDTSRRNHELTARIAELSATIAAFKKQELLVDPEAEIEHPMSVSAADKAVTESRRALAAVDKQVRPLPDGPIENNDEEDDAN